MVLLYSCLVIGLSALGVSIHYSILWFSNQGAGLFLSVVFALIYVGATTIAFEKGVEQLTLFGNIEKGKTYKRKKRSYYFLAGVFVLALWAVGAAYSMLSTIGGQYSQLVTMDRGETMAVDRTDFLSIQERQEDDRAALKAEESILIHRAGELPPGTDWASREAINNNTTRLAAVRAELKAIDEYLISIAPEVGRQAHKETFNISERNFYVYLGAITERDPVKIQYKLSLFPSVTTDIISPVFITIFIIGWRREKQRRKERARAVRKVAPPGPRSVPQQQPKKTINMGRRQYNQAELFK